MYNIEETTIQKPSSDVDERAPLDGQQVWCPGSPILILEILTRDSLVDIGYYEINWKSRVYSLGARKKSEEWIKRIP